MENIRQLTEELRGLRRRDSSDCDCANDRKPRAAARPLKTSLVDGARIRERRYTPPGEREYARRREVNAEYEFQMRST